jgi:hypothetical protein
MLVLVCQLFAPTKLEITFETKGKGAFKKNEIDDIVVKNEKGEVVSLNLPEKFVYIANHQVRCAFFRAIRWLTGAISRFMRIGGMHGVSFITSEEVYMNTFTSR